MPVLKTLDPDLRDLARGSPDLVEAAFQRRTGIRLMNCLGVGGMATVFLGELNPTARSNDLSPLCPRRLAIKMMKPSTLYELEMAGLSQDNSFVREAVSLGRIMERKPPTEFVLGFYGCGYTAVDLGKRLLKLPWLAIEYVDGGTDGASLTDRIGRMRDGCDPVRALRLVRGLLEGVRVLHEEGIIHRDLKPDNVLVVGPVDDETPKIADCGVARVRGLMSTIASLTWEYSAPEQMLSRPLESNPLIGTWTDIHALSAVLWFILGGEHWCRGKSDKSWRHGERRSLRTAAHLHPGFAANGALVDKLDEVLQRGASPSLPDAMERASSRRSPQARRICTVEALRDEVLPLMEQCAAKWAAQAAYQTHAATCFRTTQPVEDGAESVELLAEVIERHPSELIGVGTIDPGGAAILPDGRSLVRIGSKVFFLMDDRPMELPVRSEESKIIASSKYVIRGPGGGFALVGPNHIRLIRSGYFRSMGLPCSNPPTKVGVIDAAVGDGRVFGVVTRETEESEGGHELWTSNDGVKWEKPLWLPLSGRVRSVASGPYGYMVVGVSQRGNRARALFVGFDGQTNVYGAGVNDKPPLLTALCGADRLSWAAGKGFVLAFDRGVVHQEDVEVDEEPVAMGLDSVGVPWLATKSTLLRRHVSVSHAKWKTYYCQDPGEPPWVALGLTMDGARLFDAAGRIVEVVPHDIASWKGLQQIAS